jgi:hypothetical protein
VDEGTWVDVIVDVSGPVTGIPGWAVWVNATAKVSAMAVLMRSGSGVDGPSEVQAWVAIKKTKPIKSFRIVLRIVPHFNQQS